MPNPARYPRPGRQDGGDRERTDHRPGLVHRLVQAEAPAVSDLPGGVREHHIAGRRADRLAHPLGDDQRRGDLPAARQRHHRDGQHIDRVADQRHRPVPCRPIGDVAGDQPQGIPDQLAQSGHQPHGESARAQGTQERASDAPRPLVGHVREQAHHADHDHELERRSSRQLGRPSRGIPCILHRSFRPLNRPGIP